MKDSGPASTCIPTFPCVILTLSTYPFPNNKSVVKYHIQLPSNHMFVARDDGMPDNTTSAMIIVVLTFVDVIEKSLDCNETPVISVAVMHDTLARIAVAPILIATPDSAPNIVIRCNSNVSNDEYDSQITY